MGMGMGVRDVSLSERGVMIAMAVTGHGSFGGG